MRHSEAGSDLGWNEVQEFDPMLRDMLPEVRSLFAMADEGRGEVLVPLLEGGGFRLEQIVSFGAGSDPGFWYDQDQPEWVVLVRGAAVLEFEAGRLDLVGGDALLIPQRLKHRVVGTSPDAVWLALHFEASGADEAKTV